MATVRPRGLMIQCNNEKIVFVHLNPFCDSLEGEEEEEEEEEEGEEEDYYSNVI